MSNFGKFNVPDELKIVLDHYKEVENFIVKMVHAEDSLGLDLSYQLALSALSRLKDCISDNLSD